LVVEDNDRLRTALLDALGVSGWQARGVASVADAWSALRGGFRPELLLLDLVLRDGDGFQLLDKIVGVEPTPTVVAISGSASASEAFRLGQRGVRGFLSKPLNLAALDAAIEQAFSSPPDLTLHLKAAVGLVPIRRLEEDVRTTMVREALARSAGSRRGAARALQISRQLLQHIIRAAT
jgi:two-component system, response regulator RegA